MGKAHWATAGLLVVAAVIHNIETAKRVNKECLELLASINTVGKTLSRFSKLQVIPDEMKSTVTEAKTVIAKSAACCLSIIHSPILHKFIFSSKNEEQISSCAKRLEKLQHDLSFQLIFADYTERHELKKKKTLNEDEIISLPTSPHGGGNQPDGKTKDKRRTCFSRFDVICKKDGKRRTCNGILHRICKKDGQRPGSEHPSGKSSDAEKDSAVKIEEMLSLDSKEPAIAVFICGPWRTGKSRVADKVCSKLQRQLSKKNWKQIKIKITEVDTAEEGSVSNLDLVPGVRSKFLAKLQQTGNQKGTENIKEIESDNEWQKVVSRNLRDKSLKVFIYIDNVPSAEFLKKILPKKISEGNQMRLLVTIVDKNVASATEGSVFRKQLYVIRSLSYNQSLNFFAKKLPKEKTHTLVLRVIIKICEGYKTQMKMVRNYLMKYFGDDESFGRLTEWIKTEEPKFPKLMDYLSCEEQFNHQSAAIKEALLDICSFFSGWEWNKTACILDKDVLDKLKQLEMVKRESNKVCVPDKVMTYCLSRGKGTRITSATDLYAVPAEGKFHSIKGIWLVQNKCPIRISSQKLDEMPNLRVLALGDWTIVEGDCKKNFSNLRYFQAGRVEHLPFNISQLDNIRFMDNNSDRKMGISTLQDPYIKKLEQGSFNFFDGKWVFVDVNGRPFYSSTSLEEGKTVAVIFNHSYQKEELHALGEILDDLRASCKDMQVLQVSRFVSSLARELAGKHHVFSCDNYEAQVFFEEALSTVESFDQEMEYAMIISDVIRGPKQHKAFSTWMGITKNSLRAMTVEVPRAEYLRLKELTDTPQDSNIKLLQALLLTKEIDFLVTRTSQMGIKQLEGKFVFLLVSWLHDIEKESEDFKSVYDKLKGMLSMENKENFEAVWIPRVIHGRESRSLHAKGVEKIGFPSIADPWSINPVVMHLLRRRSTFNKLPLLLAVDPKGVLYLDNLIPETESIKKAVAIENATEALYNFLTERGSNSDKIQEEEDGPGS
ncbi:uncharacterized protein LOC131075899 isoform X3 [Cryptomeria japonica]|uniref:uncharacterized protein LOC131075899 isoform X3 n=1 Tax=Cryptomeria japonica TaxID=3369 RepID=UPI0027DA283B|nr:uncharacterized protein LOC131075899 isoform X3 [Cryptomeria japonica]